MSSKAKAELEKQLKIFEAGLETKLRTVKFKNIVGAGMLRPGQVQSLEVVLRGGVEYRIYVDADEPGVDFDLYVYDEEQNLVKKDTRTITDAECVITPGWTGPFRLEVKSAKGLSTFYVLVYELA